MIPKAPHSLHASCTDLLAVPSTYQMYFYLRDFVFVVPSAQNAPPSSGLYSNVLFPVRTFLATLSKIPDTPISLQALLFFPALSSPCMLPVLLAVCLSARKLIEKGFLYMEAPWKTKVLILLLITVFPELMQRHSTNMSCMNKCIMWLPQMRAISLLLSIWNISDT